MSPSSSAGIVASNAASNARSASVQDGGFVQSLTELGAEAVRMNAAAVNSVIKTPFATVQVTGTGDQINVDGTTFGGRGSSNWYRATSYEGATATVFFGPSNYYNNGQLSNWISFSGQAAVLSGSNAILTGGLALGGTDSKGNIVGASLDAFGGATIYNATAGAGGFLDAGGASVGGGDLTHGNSLIQNAHILSDGFGIAGGNKGLVITKNGTTGIASGTGTLADILVDAGGIVDANSNGTVLGGTIAGYALTESGGTISGVLFNGVPGNGFAGLNGYIDAGGVFQSNLLASGAKVSVGGGLASGNTIMAGGTLEVGANYAHHVTQGPGGGQIIITGTEFGSGTSLHGVVSDGGVQIVDSGGVDSDTTVMSGGVVSVNEYGTDALAIISHGGTMIVNDGAFATGAVISGTMTNYGMTDDTTIGDGGTQIMLGSDAFGERAQVDKGGLLSLGGGAQQAGVQVNPGGTMVIDSGAVVMGATIGAGMNKWVGPSGEGTVSDNLGQDGGIIHAGGQLSSGWLNDGTGTGSTVTEMGGLLRVERGATVTDLHMGNYAQIEVLGVKYNAGESVIYTNNQITLMSDNQSVWGASLSGNYNPSSFQVWDDNGTAVIVYDTCFLSGTRLSTPEGEVEVQNLRAGDKIVAIMDGREIVRDIISVRRERSHIRKNLPLDMAGWAVCIKEGAFGAGLPKRDLRVTSEHCFYFEGRFIPIRMLVNGFSIYYDTSLEHFEFFHLETNPHSIIRAEGVLTESWLNTEEKREVINLSNGVTRLERIASHQWEKDAAAPLDVSPVFAEHLWKMFKYRALQLGILAQQDVPLLFSNDPGLHLRLDDGRVVKPLNKRGNQYFFRLPVGTNGISLVSKTFRPCESVGPWMDDRRQLGVLVGKMTVAIGETFRPVNEHYHVANMRGWDIVENSPCRWTNGNAELPDIGTAEELRLGISLIIEVIAGGPYPEQQAGCETFQSFEKEA